MLVQARETFDLFRRQLEVEYTAVVLDASPLRRLGDDDEALQRRRKNGGRVSEAVLAKRVTETGDKATTRRMADALGRGRSE